MIKPKYQTNKGKRYFTKETENYIIQYNKETNPRIKSGIYERYIHYALFKLTQNIIHTFKFYNTEVENLEDLQHEIIIFLLSKIHLYNQTQNVQDKITKILKKNYNLEFKGDFPAYVNYTDIITQSQIKLFIENEMDVSDEIKEELLKIKVPKAYSYFGTIVKRWLIAYNMKNYKKKISKVDISELTKENSDYYYDIEDEVYNEKLNYFIDEFIIYIEENIYNLFPKKNDAQIADAILELFRKRENLKFFNKKALYFNIREMVDVKTPKITKIATKLYDIFKDNYLFYLENNYVDFED